MSSEDDILEIWTLISRGTGTQLENVISEGIIHQKIARSARGMSLEHSKTCGTCSAGVTYSVVNRVWQNAGYWRRCLLLNLHKVEILEILTLISGGTLPPTEGALFQHTLLAFKRYARS